MVNILGQTVYTKELENFDNGNFKFDGAAGVYILKIKTEDKTRVYKIIKN